MSKDYIHMKKWDAVNDLANQKENVTLCSWTLYSHLVFLLGKKVKYIELEFPNHKVKPIGISYKETIIIPDTRLK